MFGVWVVGDEMHFEFAAAHLPQSGEVDVGGGGNEAEGVGIIGVYECDSEFEFMHMVELE